MIFRIFRVLNGRLDVNSKLENTLTFWEITYFKIYISAYPKFNPTEQLFSSSACNQILRWVENIPATPVFNQFRHTWRAVVKVEVSQDDVEGHQVFQHLLSFWWYGWWLAKLSPPLKQPVQLLTPYWCITWDNAVKWVADYYWKSVKYTEMGVITA